MKYDDAFELLKQGKAVARENWKGYKYLKITGMKVMNFEAVTNICLLSFNPTALDLEADDWLEYTGASISANADGRVKNNKIIPTKHYVSSKTKKTKQGKP